MNETQMNSNLEVIEMSLCNVTSNVLPDVLLAIYERRKGHKFCGWRCVSEYCSNTYPSLATCLTISDFSEHSIREVKANSNLLNLFIDLLVYLMNIGLGYMDISRHFKVHTIYLRTFCYLLLNISKIESEI